MLLKTDEGKCSVCGSPGEYFLPYKGASLRESICGNCGSRRRTRDLARVLLEKMNISDNYSVSEALDSLRNVRIIEFSPTGALHDVLKQLPNYVYTTYPNDVAPGKYKWDCKTGQSIICQDLQCLTFVDGTTDSGFDFAITEDIFEHLDDPWEAFKEVNRILKPGGIHIFTVPFHSGNLCETRIERTFRGDQHDLFPRVTHDDPLRNGGIPVVTDFGDDLPVRLATLGIDCAIAREHRFYKDSQIPRIHTPGDARRYQKFVKKERVLKFFLYNSVVFAATHKTGNANMADKNSQIRVKFQTQTDPYQIACPAMLANNAKELPEIDFIRGETVRFCGRSSLMCDIGLKCGPRDLPPVLLVETYLGDLTTFVLPSSLKDCAKLGELLEKRVLPLLKGLPAGVHSFHINGAGAPIERPGRGERVLPGMTPCSMFAAHLGLYDFVRSRLPEPCEKILDIGCGVGYGLARLANSAGCAGMGTDSATEMIRAAQRLYPNFTWKQAAPENLLDDPSFPAHSFNAVTCFEYLAYLEDPETCLKLISQALAPGGSAWISVPNPVFGEKNPFHKREYTFTRLKTLLAKYFRTIEHYYQNDQPDEYLGTRFPIRKGEESDAQFWLVQCCDPVQEQRPQRDVSIIMPLFNKIEYTRKAVDSIYENTPDTIDWELILVDNGSTDATAAEKARDERTFIWRNPRNEGFAKASNQGAFLAGGRYLVFLNNDTEVRPGWLEALLSELDEHPDTGLVGARLLYPNGTIQHAGVAIGRDMIPYHIHQGLAGDDPIVMKRREFPIVTGACLAARRDEFMALGMFDEQFVNGHEDIDLCLRYREKGKHCIYRPDCLVIHYESVSEGRLAARQQNLERTFAKWRHALVQDDFCYASLSVPQRPHRLRFAIKICTPNRKDNRWGDIYYAESLAKELIKSGHSCVIHYRNEWGSEDTDIDVVIHMKGLARYFPKPWNINIMWMLNHPTRHTKEELETYDAICVASEPYAEELKKRLSVPVFTLLQATDPDHFKPVPGITQKRYDVVFVGTNIGIDREAIRRSIGNLFQDGDSKLPFSFAVWGQGWKDRIPARYIQADFISWEKLPELYRSARIVLNDHLPTMAEYGFVNNRTFDVAACGTPLISDPVKAMNSIMDVCQCEDGISLRQTIRQWLDNPEEAQRLADHNREKTLAGFTFAHRVRELEGILESIDTKKTRDRVNTHRIRALDPEFRIHGPCVSVLMSTHDRREFLPNAIASVREQTYQDWELLIVRDGGAPVEDIVESFHDARISLIDVPENHGKGSSINLAFKHSKGEYIAYLDDDDTWRPDHLERLMLALRGIPGFKMVYSDAEYVVLDMSKPAPFREKERKLRYSSQVVLKDLLEYNSINGISVVHSRSLFTDAGGFDSHLKALIDFDMWRRLACFSYPYHVSYVTADHIMRENSNSPHITHLVYRNEIKYMAQRVKIIWKDLPFPENENFAEAMALLKKKVINEFYALKFDAALENDDSKKVHAILKAIRKHNHKEFMLANIYLRMKSGTTREALALFIKYIPPKPGKPGWLQALWYTVKYGVDISYNYFNSKFPLHNSASHEKMPAKYQFVSYLIQILRRKYRRLLEKEMNTILNK